MTTSTADDPVAAPDDPAAFLADRVGRLKPRAARLVIAIAGPPASGKTTLAAALARRLVDRGRRAVAIPMDGFHLDDSVLAARGLLARKGAPETFDSAGFVHAVRRIASGGEVVLPAFDRSREIAVAGAIVVAADHDIAVIEGNYLCLKDEPWSALSETWDLTVRIDVPEAELRRRLEARWQRHGYDAAAAEAKIAGNDLPNAQLVARNSRTADVVLRWNGEDTLASGAGPA